MDKPTPYRGGIIEVSLELLAEVLQLPLGTRVESVMPPDPWRHHQRTVLIRITHEKFDVVPEGCLMQTLTVEHENHFDVTNVKVKDMTGRVLVEDTLAR